jgi:MFS superfamily sulfate permease-like transporter
MAAARTAAGTANTDANRELAGLGAANIGAGFFGGLAVQGDASRTQVNIDSGARSKAAALTVAGLTLLLLLLTGLLEFLPLAVLAAVAITIAVRLINVPYFERLYALARAEGGVSGLASAQTLQDFTGAVCAAAGVLVLGVMPGFVVAVVASIVLLMLRVSRPRISVEFGSHGNGAEQPEVTPACVVLRPEASPFFANAESMHAAIDRFDEEYDAGVVVLDLERTPYVDVAGAELIVELAASFEARGKRLLVVRSMGPARRLLLATAASHDAYIDIFASVDAALGSVSGATLDERLRRRRPA